MAGWEDVPHIPEAEKQRLLDGTPPYLRDARSKGIPSVGSGAIYPVPLEDMVCDDFAIPSYWPVGYGMDVGWKATAAVWGAKNNVTDCIYLYREYKRGQAEPAVHASAIRAGGQQLTGAIDPASRGRSQKDGTQLIVEYQELGLNLVPALNAVDAGLFEVYSRLTTGRLKIFRSLTETQQEIRLYRRDERGNIVKENDHLMDCTRYLVATADQVICWQVNQPRITVIGTANSHRYTN
jgi:hypothetical protein